ERARRLQCDRFDVAHSVDGGDENRPAGGEGGEENLALKSGSENEDDERDQRDRRDGAQELDDGVRGRVQKSARTDRHAGRDGDHYGDTEADRPSAHRVADGGPQFRAARHSGEFPQITGDARKGLLRQQPEDCGKFEYGQHRREPRRAEKSVLEFRRSGESPSWAGNNRLRHGRSPGQRKLLPGAASVASRNGGTAD